MDRVFDAVVVGGGPAGLTGALHLTRLRRTVLIIDEGHSRAVRIARVHDYPGFAEGVEGPTLVAAMQHQALRHGVNFAIGRAASIDRKPEGFEVAWAGGQAAARSVLLATGVRDIEPIVPHLAEAVRTGLLRHCPVSDSYEVIDRAVGLIGDGPRAVGEALWMRHFAARVTLLPSRRESGISDDDRRSLVAAGVEVVDMPTTAIQPRDGAIVAVHGDRETVCDALYSALGLYVHSELALRLGARHDNEGFLVTDSHHETSVEGLYAAGDVVRGLNSLCVATGGAAIAAAAMHLALQAAEALHHDAAPAVLMAAR